MRPDLPVIDVSGLRGGPAARHAVAAALGGACRDAGFFLAAGHGLPEALREAAFAAAQAFFTQPQAVKEAVSIRHSPHTRGYVGLREEQLDPAHPADVKEAYNIGLETAPDHPALLAGTPFRGENLWPALPGFRAATLAWFDTCWALGRLLHRGFALDLGLDEAFFEPRLDQPMATLRLLRYPGGDGEGLGAGEHTDYGNCTILATDGTPGLELRRRDGAWIAVPDIPGTLVCNIGDCLMRWSNGTYASTPHQVRNPDRLRHSLAFFLDPNPGAVLAALPGTTGPGRPALWPPVTAADYLRSRLDATYGKPPAPA